MGALFRFIAWVAANINRWGAAVARHYNRIVAWINANAKRVLAWINGGYRVRHNPRMDSAHPRDRLRRLIAGAVTSVAAPAQGKKERE